MGEPEWIEPDWPAPPRVRAASTLRHGGVSRGGHASLNLATHVGDDPRAVAENRRRLRMALSLPAAPDWLTQTHSLRVIDLERTADRDGDAALTRQPGQVAVVMTADCLPVLFCDDRGSVVAAAHAGWRGLAGGILENTIAAMDCAPRTLLAWLGPAIGPRYFEVGDAVRDLFLRDLPQAVPAFAATRPGHWLCDLYALARLRLQRAGVTRIHGGERCTFAEESAFFSYRREPRCGRQASLIWLRDCPP
jgi:YfiH family protein